MTGDEGESAPLRRAGKSEAAFRTISEVAEDLDVPQHVLRFWESKFPQVKPLKRGGGRRYYRPEDVALLRRIRDLLYNEGYTIKGVQKLLREVGGKELLSSPKAQVELSLPLTDQPADTTNDTASQKTEEMPVPDQDAPQLQASQPLVASASVSVPTDEDGGHGEDEAAVQDAATAASDIAVSSGVRQELKAILTELEELRNLLQPRR
jgi:DNA-binding transcriptional MerR regulator